METIEKSVIKQAVLKLVIFVVAWASAKLAPHGVNVDQHIVIGEIYYALDLIRHDIVNRYPNNVLIKTWLS